MSDPVLETKFGFPNPFMNKRVSEPVPIETNVNHLCNVLAVAEVIKFRAIMRDAGLLKGVE